VEARAGKLTRARLRCSPAVRWYCRRVPSEERTQVGIVGAGPAGLVLGRLLEREGIESVILEARSRDYVEHRIRAGVLEHDTAELLSELGVGERMRAEGLVHDGIELC